MMDFLVQWFWYLVAFAVGALCAWFVASRSIEARYEDEAFADVAGVRGNGGQR